MTYKHSLLCFLLIVVLNAYGFVPASRHLSWVRNHNDLKFFSTNDNDSSFDVQVNDAKNSLQDIASNEFKGERAEYPIDLPSPLLLSLSMVLAIISIGTAFDLAGKQIYQVFCT